MNKTRTGNIFYKKLIVLLFIGNLCFLDNKAQIISYPTSAQTLIRGYGSALLNVKIDFPACTDLKVTINLGATNSPGIIDYIPGTVIKTAGAATISEFNISDLRNPIFQISNTSPGESITFTIDRKSECGFPISTKDFILVTGTGAGCNVNDINPNTNGYLLRAPALTVNAPAPITNAALNGVYTRNFSIVNGGNGVTDTLRFYIIYEASKSENNSPIDAIVANSISFTPWKTNGDTLFYKIFGSTIFGTDNVFLNGETVNITEEVKILKCDPIIKYAAQWGRNLQNICATTFGQSGITMSNAVPNLVASIPVPDYNYCFTGDVKKQTIRIVNRGTGPAINIKSYFGTVFIGSFQASITFDTITPWIIKNKLGATIGRVSNFSSNIIRVSKNASCANINGVNETIGSFGNIILPAGDTIYVDVYTLGDNLNCGTCFTAVGWTGIQTNVMYNNQCGTANYNTGPVSHMTRAYTYINYSVDVPTDILPGEAFDIKMYMGNFSNIQNPNGTGSTMFVLPLAGLNMLPTATSVKYGPGTSFGQLIFPINVRNDTMFVGPIPQNVGISGEHLIINMMPFCGTAGAKTLRPYFANSYGSCSPVIKFGCRVNTTTLHCPAPCPKGGATPLRFTLNRINLGLPDNNNDGIPDAAGTVINRDSIDTHHSVNGDTLLGKWNIKVYPNVDATDPNFGKRIAFVYVDFKCGGSAVAGPGTLTPVANAKATIYPSGGGAPIVCTPRFTMLANFGHYELDSFCRGMAWQGGDSMVFEAKYTVNQYNADRYNNANASAYDLFVTVNEVYSTYTPKATVQTAPILGQTYTCDHFNDYNEISRIWLSNWIYANRPINGCSGIIESYMRQYLRGQEGGGIFPYEYRNFFIHDSMTVLLPPGFDYRPNSATFTSQDFGGGTVVIPNSKVSQIGNKLYFTTLKTFFTPFGGTLNPGDELSQMYIRFSLDPQCNAVNGTFPNSTHTSGVGNGLNTPLVYGTTPAFNTTNPIGYIYTAPQPVLSGGGLIVSSNGSATWNVVIQNANTSIAANNSYFSIVSTSSFTNIVAKEGATVITPINGIYQLSNLLGSANRIITISATITACKVDSILVNYSWDCKGYPLNSSVINCAKPLWLNMDNSISQIQIVVNKEPTGPDIPLCEIDDIEFVFNSAQSSNVNNPQIRIVPPVGANIISAEIEYPVGSGNFESITPTIVGGVYVYNLEDHSLILPEGLYGTVANPSQPGRTAKLLLLYETTCQFSSGSRFYAQIRGDRPCGSPIAIAQGYNAFLRTEPIFITGSPSGSLFSFNLGLSSTVISCGQTRISGSVTPIGGPSTNTDTILVTIPNGLIYNGGFSSTSGVGVITGYPIAGPNNTQILALKIPQGVAIGTVISYGFDITANASSGCTDFNIFSEVKRSYSTFNCAGTPCNNPFSAIIGSQSNTLTVSRPNPVINYITYASGNFIANDSALVNVTITNTHPTLNAAANTLAVEFYCGIPGTLFETILLPIAINANSSITHQFRVHFVGSPLCATGDVLTAMIRPATSICICDSSAYTLPGVVLPVKFKVFTAQKSNNNALLKWQIADKANNIIFGVQRSINGIGFSTIATINGNIALNYEYTDENPIEGKKNYYRIVQQSNATNASRTSIKMLNYLMSNEINVIANQGALFWIIQFGNEHINQLKTVQILNSNGQVVLSKIINKSIESYNIPTQNLPNGNYILKIGNNNATIFTKKLLKF